VSDAAFQRDLRELLAERVAFDVPMARHTSLRVGGPVDALATPADRAELAALLALCKRRGWPQRVIGAGFNTLVRDEGLDGVAIRLSRFRALLVLPGPRVQAEAGVSHASLTGLCARQGLAGLEFGAGIPGTVGGWLAMNAGIGTREVKDVVESVELLVPGEQSTRTVEAQALEFRYRELRGTAPGAVLVAASFRVEPSTPEAVQRTMDALLARRAATQPLDVPSCGSVFKNPPGDFAGRLIEQAGLKGEREGGAEISTVHANFIVNRGGARARDVLALVERVRRRVAEHSGVVLEPEVRILGRGAP
jgi:UDP-N-acetylmuramate dehydrogenase